MLIGCGNCVIVCDRVIWCERVGVIVYDRVGVIVFQRVIVYDRVCDRVIVCDLV